MSVDDLNFRDCDIEVKRLDDLNPAEYNPRSISDKAFSGLGNSIEKFGLMMPIIWNKRSGNIVGGHQRYTYLKSQGVEESEVSVVDLDYEDEVALNLTLNNPNIRGKFTKEVIDQLKISEAAMGSAFTDVGLSDLLGNLGKVQWEKAERSPKSSGGNDSLNPPSRLVIRCPECKSRFDMKSGEPV